MYLSRLDIHGFKSFAAPTEFQFDPGITAIVGPNGCGKSNVVDAIRWVVGEQRARILRSDKMDSVIFNGSARRRALGMAEVQLTIQNTRGLLPTEFSEVTLGRRLFRSGDSEYLLNGTVCRLRDVVELFLDTGMGAGAYSVIELKMVEDILSESAQDRRRLFEEAAGITKYKLRRVQALRKLEGLQADLARVRDIVREVTRRVARLERQAKAAARHEVLTRRASALALSLACLEHSRLKKELAAVTAHLERKRASLVRIEVESESLEALLQACKAAHIGYEQGQVHADRTLSEHKERVSELASALRLAKERHAAALRDIERFRKGHASALARKASRERTLKQLHQEADALQPQRTHTAKALKTATGTRDAVRRNLARNRSALHKLSKEQAAAGSARAAGLRRLDRITNRLELAGAEAERLRSEAARAAGAIEGAQSRLDGATAACANAACVLENAQQTAAKAFAEYQRLQDQVEADSSEARTLAENLAAKQAEAALLEAMVSGYEDFPEATRFLAGSADRLLTVSDVLETDASYRAALGAALGVLGACIIVRTAEEVHSAVARLKQHRKGRGLFIVLDRIAKDVPPTVPRAGVRPLSDLVAVTNSAYEPLARMVLRNIYYTDDLDAVRTGPPAVPGRLVTSSGEWVDDRGFVHAGSRILEASSQHIDRKARWIALTKAVDALESACEKQERVLDAHRRDQHALSLPAVREELRAAENAMAAAERDAARCRDDLKAARVRRAKLEARIQEGVERAGAMKLEADGLQEQAAAMTARFDALKARSAALQKVLQTTESESTACEDDYAAAHLAHQDVCNNLDRVRRDVVRVGRERKAAVERADALATEVNDLGSMLSSLAADITTLDTDQRKESARWASLDEAVRASRTRIMENRVEIDQLEQALRKLRREYGEETQDERAYAVRCASLSTKMEEVATAVRETYGVAPDDADIPDGADEAAVRADLEQVQARLRSMGNVNALALNDFEKERERKAFLMTQLDDLSKAEATLLETTAEINRTASKRFGETFGKIRKNFLKLFGELFGGDTSADLRLVQNGDLLEAPISITARPRGKRPIGIAQLSSGEKTLTAIALLFAIYQVKPSPFCFLDEVDAPLDDANIERFMRLIRRFSLDTQFILVTHNKRTMEMADRLYGITMQEEGVSRLVGVRFEEAMAMAG